MECSRVHLELPGLLYDDIDEQTRTTVEAHLASCKRCAEEFASLKRTISRLNDWPAPQFEGSADKLIDSIRREQHEPKSRQVFSFTPLLTGAVAAAVVFGSLVVLGTNVSYGSGGLSVSFARNDAISPAENDDMDEYLLVLHEDPAAAADFPPERIPQMVSEYKAWARTVAQRGRFVAGQKLADEPGKILSGPGERVAVADASWDNIDDIVTGFFQIRAASYEEAVEISKTCPHVKYGKHIEVRRIEPTN